MFLLINVLIIGQAFAVPKPKIDSKSSGSADWSYDGINGPGPENWPGICTTGTFQSPINIESQNTTEIEEKPFIFHGYDVTPKNAEISNNGHTVGITFENQRISLSGGGLPGGYTYHSLHFHWGQKNIVSKGSEHLIDGNAYPLELHLVHFKSEYGGIDRTKRDGLAVLGIFFQIQEEDNRDLNNFINSLEKVQHKDDTENIQPFPLEKLLPRNTDMFYRYEGSLTTPTCDEIVVWTVFKDPVGISKSQLGEFHKLFEESSKDTTKKLKNNFRPEQDLNSREVFDVDTSIKKFSNGKKKCKPGYNLICVRVQRENKYWMQHRHRYY